MKCLEQTLLSWFRVPERNHLLLMVALSFLLGCLLALHFLPGGWLWLLAAGALAIAVLLKLLGRRACAALMLLFFALGVLRTHAAWETPQPAPGTYEIEATVSGGTRPRTDNRVTFNLTSVLLNGEPAYGSGYCSLHYEDEPPVLFDGARIRFSGRVYLPDGKSGEPHMDFALWMRQQGMSFGVAAYQEVELLNDRSSAPIADPWYRMRQAFGASLERIMGSHSRIAMALLLGERSGMTDEENTAFQQLGIAHVMSVSGLHVSIVGGILCWLMDRLRMSRRSQLPVLAALLTSYCALTGFSAAALRAAVMLMSYSIARTLLRYPDRLTVLGGSMLAVLLLQPLQAYSAGFVLSYSAMLGITLHSHAVREFLSLLGPAGERQPASRQRRLSRRIQSGMLDMLTTSITAQLGVLLPTMAYFYQLPLYGVAINMLIVPLVSFVLMPLYTAALPMSLIPLLGDAVGKIASLATGLLLWLVQQLSSLPYAAVRTPAPSAVLCIGLGLALVLLSRRMPGRLRTRIMAASLTVLAAVGIAWLNQPAEVRYIQLSVGQADSALLMDGDQTILIDCGADGDAALDYLMDVCRDIDALVITHLHMDHIGGVEQLLDSPVRIRQVYLPVNAERQRADKDALLLLDRIRAQGIPVAELASGDELRYNKTSLRVLWPVRAHVRSGHDANELPLVTAINLDGYTLLSASDLEGIYENYAAVPADVLKVAHHGSADSTSAAFLHFVSPRYAIISASSGSRYLPGAETLRRLEEAEIELLRTDVCGDITLSVEDGALIVTPYKAR